MWFQLGFCSGSHFVSPAPQLCSSWHFPSLISGSLPISLASLLHLSLLILIPPFSLFLSLHVYEEQLSRAWPEVGCGWQAGCSHPTLGPLSGSGETGRWGQRRALSLSFSMPHTHSHKEALVPPRGAMLPKHTD